ncbi:MAG TPA: translocation/assembly module TamB domain-containing protein, partial [Flavobacterium sp.]|nr:translocation/assembly module TamB domain-containing protein [Flavobacterium sp.]
LHIDNLAIGFPKKIVLEGVYFEDQKGDTLISGERLAVNISLFKLLDNQLEINSVDLRGIVANVSRDKDSVFNFDYIIDAFASDKPADTTSAPMVISVSDINLDRIRIKFDDQITRNDIAASLHHFDTRIKTFDLEKTEFEVPKITMDGLTVSLKQGELVREIGNESAQLADSLSARPNFKLKLGEVDFRRIDVGYDNAGTHLNSGVKLQKLYLKFNATDINNELIDIENFEVSGLDGKLVMGLAEQQPKTTSRPEVTAAPTSNWKLKLAKANLNNVNFIFDDQNVKKAPRGIDYKHLALQDFNLDARNISYTSDEISGSLRSLTAKERSGLNIQAMRTDFLYGSKNAHLKNLYIQTPQTKLQEEIIISYPSIAALSENIGELGLDASLDGSHIGFKDILTFVPGLANTKPFSNNQNAIMHINGTINGKVRDINIPNLELYGIGSTKVAASGRITGLPDAENAYFDLVIRDLQSSARDIAGFVPNGTIPNNIQLPARLGLRGTFKGAIKNFNTDLALRSSDGNAKIKAAFDQRIKNRERYNAVAVIDNFNVGRLIKNDSLGRISLRANVKGTGMDPKTATATLDGKLIKADFNSYTYRNLAINGGVQRGVYEVKADMKDPNLTFDLASNGDFNGKDPEVKVRLNVDIADLEALNLHAGVLKLRGKVDADIPTANPDYLNGKISAYHFVVANEKDQFILDSINVIAVATPELNSISLKSQFMRADVTGKYQLTKIGAALANSIAKYYNTNPTATKTPLAPQQMAFNVTVNNDPILTKLIPQLERLEPITLAGRYNSVNDSIVVNGQIPMLVYGPNTISGGVVTIDTRDNTLFYDVNIGQIESSQILLPNTSLAGEVKDNTVSYLLQIRDKKEDERYALAGTLTAKDGNTEIKLEPEGLVLNYNPWNIDPANIIRLGKGGIYANEFELAHEGSSITLQSQSTSPSAPLNVEFSDFDIETITGMVQKEGEEGISIGGKINGTTEIRNLNTKPVFVADLNIENFTFRKDTVGNIAIDVHNRTANTYTAKVEITGQGNQVNLDGFYRADNSSFDLTLAMERLQLKSIQGFTMGNMTKSSGYLTSDMRITGTADQPNIRGKIKFNEGAFTVTPLNSAFKLVNDEITFNDQGIAFNKFSLTDEADNKLSIDGQVLTQTYRDFGFALQLRADNFRAINSTAKDNDLFYGKLFLDTNLSIKGDMAMPVVNGTIKINEDTDFSVVLPQSDPAVADREGIVEFIDQDNPQLTERLNTAVDSLNQSAFKGMDVAVNIEIVKEAELSLIIDEGNGDFVSLKGEAQLSGGIDPSGKTSLTGTYEISEGAYEMSFNFIRRKFEIEEGSSITWTGEPTAANLNITAVYTANTAPIDLVGDQLGSVTPAVRNQYKQKLPFETLLKLNGELLKPEITFDIVLPEGNYGVATDIVEDSRTKLEQLRQQPSELNKQVFALLLLNRFIGENPFASEAGSASAESMARQSVSKILSQQLNDLAGDMIAGVELNFDLESTEDYTTGTMANRTDLNVGLSKRLLNDRLKVTVGSSFGLEGPQQANQETNSIAGDVSVDYQLTKDGRYLVRAYRQDEYQVALQGQVIETGVGFILTMDYNEFRELFHRTKEEKKMIRQQRKKEREKKEREQLEKEKEPATDPEETKE